MAAIFGEGKIFGKLQRLHSLDPLWVENFAEIALSRTVKEIEANLCFAIFGKNSKIQNGRHFWGGEIFLKIANSRTQPHFRSRCRKNQLGENKPARKTVIHVFNFPDIYMFILYVLANSSLKVCSAYI